ncbi:hypothetical protein [Phascolarctobacterium sp.]|uniref:hypothetical protein n=1 Tax=Phascolarctobacterium sp. TaxID=2049039 RepID=UPI0025EE5F69|nr:hypothetical protein [Phascolarctobacterium sp.]
MNQANRRLLKLLFGCVLVLLLALSVRCSICTAAERARTSTQEVTVQIPLSKLVELNDLMTSQEQKIELLEQQLTEPQTTLKEQQNLISELRRNLQEAQNSLSKSELIIAEQNASLQNLSATMAQEQKRIKKIERQRLIWQLVAGGMAVTLIRKAAQ